MQDIILQQKMWSTQKNNCVLFFYLCFLLTINLIFNKSDFIILAHSISAQKLVCCFLWYQSLTAHRLIQHKYWHRSLRGPCELQPPLPQSEMVLAHILDIGRQNQPAGSLQPLAGVCWGKISLSAPENLLLLQPPVGRKKPGWKRSKPHVKLYRGI